MSVQVSDALGLLYFAALAFWAGRSSVRLPAQTPQHVVGAVITEVGSSVLDTLRFVGPDCTVSRKATLFPRGKNEAAVWILVTTREPVL